MDLASQTPAKNKKGATYKKGQVYTMRGLGGIFSTGMNRLENTLDNEYNIRTASTIWYKANKLSDYIIEHRKSQELAGPIVLIGHSLGANEQIKVAQNLYKAHIPVDLLITVDAVAPVKVPPNVKYVLNLYKPAYVPMFSGLKIKAEDPEFTYVNNFDVSKLNAIYVNHFTIDKNKEIQKIMLDNVLAVINHTPREHA
ncbi:alpha/beta hydrolase family protein [Legionella clemsonensis]|nr:thioesterase domain-containing protein [Legionella clemsonensis]